MIIVDAFIVLFVIGLLIVGVPIIAKKLHLRDPKRKEIDAARELDDQGEVNTVKFNLDTLRRCHYCHQQTDPNKDLRSAAVWVHADCYIKHNITDSEKGKHNA